VHNVIDLATLTGHATGTGNATHLGKFTATSNNWFTPDLSYGEETAVWTAANGDELHFVLTVTALESGGYFLEATFTGGTGRFVSATGGASCLLKNPELTSDGIYLYVSFSTGGSGTITY
jgi:hypothetical protein